jgi:signal transduction histidine kinase
VELSTLVAILITLVYLDWLYLAYANRMKTNLIMSQVLITTLCIAALGSLWNTIPIDSDLPQAEVSVYLASAVLIAFGALTFYYLQWEKQVVRWIAGAGLWWLITLVLGLSDASLELGGSSWLSDAVSDGNIAALLILAGWTVIGALTLSAAFYKFYNARLPEIANRALLWAVITPLVIMGQLLGVSGSSVLRELGWVISVLGLGLVTYSVVSIRALDLRRAFRLLIANVIMVAIIALLVLGALVLADEFDQRDVNQTALYIALAIGMAVLFLPIFWVFQNVFNRIIGSASVDNLTPEIRRFAEAITGTVEMDELSGIVMQILRELLGVRRAAILLVEDEEEDQLRLAPYTENTLGDVPEATGYITPGGVIHRTLFEERKPLMQFEMDFVPEYKDVPDLERNFFRYLHMAAFAPIVLQDKLLGILACGPKGNDDRFYRADLELLSTIANQTGVAIRNARLLEDVLGRERDVAETNKRLEVAKRQLEALDAVKTDFITIASHELRTPLAQIRGHTDIISALNEQGMLDQDQLDSLTQNLRKAADRLEGLIGDMLDVSQLDLSAMDLRFVETTVENAVRMAVEPLQESIRNRKQSLTARGLRDLPAIHADMQRLVQAIRNVVLNAVKFTPDGGRIDIIGTSRPNPDTGIDEIHIEIKDSGIGIDPRNHEAVFEKFFRAFDPGLHSTGQTKFMGAGPGLGLTIAKGVIEGHGGRIWVESDKYDPDSQPGSVFHIVLPKDPPKGVRRVSPISAPTATNGKRTTPTPPRSAQSEAITEATPVVDDLSEESEEVFEEPTPTLLNPSANRAGVTAAAIQAAEQAILLDQEEQETSDDEPT